MNRLILCTVQKYLFEHQTLQVQVYHFLLYKTLLAKNMLTISCYSLISLWLSRRSHENAVSPTALALFHYSIYEQLVPLYSLFHYIACSTIQLVLLYSLFHYVACSTIQLVFHPKNNRNHCLRTEPVRTGTDAMVNVWLLCTHILYTTLKYITFGSHIYRCFCSDGLLSGDSDYFWDSARCPFFRLVKMFLQLSM